MELNSEMIEIMADHIIVPLFDLILFLLIIIFNPIISQLYIYRIPYIVYPSHVRLWSSIVYSVRIFKYLVSLCLILYLYFSFLRSATLQNIRLGYYFVGDDSDFIILLNDIIISQSRRHVS